MIVIVKRHGEGTDPVLVYDEEEGEMWGYPEMWESHIDKVGMDEEVVAAYFDGPNLFTGEAEDDPFEDMPNAEELLENYPPGSRDIPDIPNPPLPGRYEAEEEEEDETDKTAEEIAEKAAHAALGKDWGKEEDVDFEKADDVLFEMHKRLVWWKADEPAPDLSKAPAMWSGDESVPEFVKEVIRQVIDGDVVWDHFEGYSRRAAEIIQDELENALTQPQGWSIQSLVERIQDEYPGMEMEQAVNIARTETSAVLNSAREEAYQEREDADGYVYYWQGPDDHRTTKVCEEIKEEVESRGGSVPLNQLRNILANKAKKYEGTREGGTPERVSEYLPHYQCRHTMIRDIRSEL